MSQRVKVDTQVCAECQRNTFVLPNFLIAKYQKDTLWECFFCGFTVNKEVTLQRVLLRRLTFKLNLDGVVLEIC